MLYFTLEQWAALAAVLIIPWAVMSALVKVVEFMSERELRDIRKAGELLERMLRAEDSELDKHLRELESHNRLTVERKASVEGAAAAMFGFALMIWLIGEFPDAGLPLWSALASATGLGLLWRWVSLRRYTRN